MGRPKEKHTAHTKYSVYSDSTLKVRKGVKRNPLDGYDSYLKEWAEKILIRIKSFNLPHELELEVIQLANSVEIGQQALITLTEYCRKKFKGQLSRVKIDLLIRIIIDLD